MSSSFLSSFSRAVDAIHSQQHSHWQTFPLFALQFFWWLGIISIYHLPHNSVWSLWTSNRRFLNNRQHLHTNVFIINVVFATLLLGMFSFSLNFWQRNICKWIMPVCCLTFYFGKCFYHVVLSVTVWTSGVDWRVLASALAVQLVESVAQVLDLASSKDASDTHELRVPTWPSEDMPTLPEMSLSATVLTDRCVGLSRRGAFLQKGPPDQSPLSCLAARSYWGNGDGFLSNTTSCFWKLFWRAQSGERKRNGLVDHQ